jgi:tRNA threonylcarbamoyladenosine biosynthesis protein TsaE
MNLQDAITVLVTQYLCNNEAEMLALGGRLGRVLKTGDVIALTGDLGAGKTTLIRGLIQAELPGEEVPSPTYTLVQTYDLPDYELWHCDLYRLKHPDEAFELGLIDAFDDAVCVLEWPDKIGNHLPEDALTIHIAFTETGREVTLGPEWSGRDV